MKLKAQLVENWKDLWKWYSTNALLVALLINAAQETLPMMSDLIQLDPATTARATAALALVALVGRVVNQAKDVSNNIR